MNISFKYSDKNVLILTAGLLGETASEVGARPVPAWGGSEGKGREGKNGFRGREGGYMFGWTVWVLRSFTLSNAAALACCFAASSSSPSSSSSVSLSSSE